MEESNQKTLKLEKLLIRSKNEISTAVLDKDKEIKFLSFKLIEAEKRKKKEDKKYQLSLKKKISALKCNLSKMEANKNKIESKLKKIELELETERIIKRKKKVKEKSENSKVNEVTSRFTRNIECLQNKIKTLELEKVDLEGKNLKTKSLKK